MAAFDPRTLTNAVEKALEAEIGRIGEEEISEALKRTEERLRGSLSQIALRMLKEYDVEMNGSRILISVKNEI